MIHKNDVDEMDTESSIEQTLLLCWTWLVQISINEKTQNALVYKLTHYGLYKDEKHSQSNDSILNLDFILNCFKQELGYNLTNKFSFNISNESIAECLAHHTETFFNRNSIIIQILYGLIYGILMYRDTGLTSIISQNAECPKQEVIQLDSHITYMEKTPCVNSQSPENESTSVIPIVVYVHPIKHRTVQSSPNRLLVKNQQSLQLLLLLQECIFSEEISFLETNCFFCIVVNLLSSLCASFNTLLPYAQQAIIISVIPWILSCVAHHRLLWNHPLIEGKLELILLHILSHIDSSSLFNNSNLTTVHSFCYTFLNCSPYETNPRLGELTRMGDGETILSWLATGEVVNQKVVVRLQTGASDKHNLNKCNNCLHSPCLFQKQSSCSHSLYDFSTGASLRVLLVVLIFIKSLAWSALDSGSLDNILCLSGPVSKKVTLGSDGTLHSGSAPTLSEDILRFTFPG
ncbi:uncharacterized protein LOC128882540 [Hylaeus volcanicus]|uniref:uncharacterized protein LOC128882540 n=1 Tax=Hylaeus volcanicus TaxID=313075 RepID=UPI0023B86BFD|nr:uncharacterized protein LOC128882540 [Hylaeus volcanicus]